MGWKTAHQILLREGWGINRKRTRRIWRTEGLRRPVRARKRRRLQTGEAKRLRAARANDVWAVDFQFDETSDRRRIKLCNIVDEYTREALAIRVARTCTGDDLVEELAQLVAERGAPAYLRADNGPELIAWALRDYCRMTLMCTSYIEPGSPWENPFVESFNGRLRDELLNIEEFGSIAEARVVIEDWREEYNTYRPHSALGGLTPAEYAARGRENHQTTRSRIGPGPPTGAPSVVRVTHLRAALAVWSYCEQSVRLIFGTATGYPDADTALKFIRSGGRTGRTTTEIRDLFGRNKPTEPVLEFLRENSLASPREGRSTGGRAPVFWICPEYDIDDMDDKR